MEFVSSSKKAAIMAAFPWKTHLIYTYVYLVSLASSAATASKAVASITKSL